MKNMKMIIMGLAMAFAITSMVGCSTESGTLSETAETNSSTTITEPEETAGMDQQDATSSASKDKKEKGSRVPDTDEGVTVAETEAASEDRVFTLLELSTYDGKNGNAAYIAIDGVVYDVTDASGWENGNHEGYDAGQDLTEAFENSPHQDSMLNSLTVVGKLEIS